MYSLFVGQLGLEMECENSFYAFVVSITLILKILFRPRNKYLSSCNVSNVKKTSIKISSFIDHAGKSNWL